VTDYVTFFFFSSRRRHTRFHVTGVQTCLFRSKDVPQSVKTFTEPLSLKNPQAKSLPGVYILTIDPGKTAADDDFADFAKRAQQRGYQYVEMSADHNPQWSKPRELASLLLDTGK